MIINIWPYILRFALGLYFLFNHLPALLNGYKSASLGDSIFACTSAHIPPIAMFTMWHGGFVLLAMLIILWPRPIVPLSISLFVLFCITYVNFIDLKNISSLTNLLILICILINIALIIIYAKNRY